MLNCKANPVKCHSYFDDYHWEVSSLVAPANLTTHNKTGGGWRSGVNSTTTEHVLLSTLDVRHACDIMICILSLQIFRRSIASPHTTVPLPTICRMSSFLC